MKRIIIAIVLTIFAFSCAKQFPEWKGPPDREEAFPDMSFQDSSPRRRASIALTKEGMDFARRGFYTNAMKKYEKAIDVDPTNPFAYFQYGVARYGTKQHDQSFVMLEEAADKFGDNKKWQSQILTYRGLNYKELKEYDKAMDRAIKRAKKGKL